MRAVWPKERVMSSPLVMVRSKVRLSMSAIDNVSLASSNIAV